MLRGSRKPRHNWTIQGLCDVTVVTETSATVHLPYKFLVRQSASPPSITPATTKQNDEDEHNQK
jgi:hypothetical protein